MRSRRRAREAALQALYQCDTLGDWSQSTVDLYFSCFCKVDIPTDFEEVLASVEDSSAGSEKLTRLKAVEKENLHFARTLIGGTVDNREFIDRQIAAASTHWSLARMARVDRNILRLASFEMACLPDIPINVSINEAIEIARAYGSEDSPMFVNGVLDNIAKALANQPVSPEGAENHVKKKVAAGS